jgi:hypothetical protein
MTVINDIIHERREKLQILYLRLEELKNEIKNKEDELRYFENKNDLRPVSLSACKLTGKE